jgi:uncharacterized protein
MSLLVLIGLLILGLVAGYFSGLIGIGGGVIIVPALIFLFGFEQHNAQGTTLALLILPIGILAALKYYKEGFVDIPTALVISLGFVLGGYLGSLTAVHIPQDALRKIFAAVLVLLALKMFFHSDVPVK